jgi:spermidine dehydrogenase
VRKLIPSVASGVDMNDIVTAEFDYSKLDEPTSAVKMRLNSTVINVQNDKSSDTVNITYIKGKEVFGVKAKHCVLACYHSIIPHLCPQLPEAQKQAASYQVKRPLLVTNVLLRNSEAADKLGISGAYCPGRMHGATWLCKGVNAADYRHDWSDDGPVAMMFWGALAPSSSELDIKSQHRDSRLQMLALSFEDYEREVRSVLDGMLGPAGFDVENDILAITVNRWPHGYSYDYLDLWDPKWPKGEAPHEVARKPFGNIAIANSDAGASAMTNVAIDEAYRAVNELN